MGIIFSIVGAIIIGYLAGIVVGGIAARLQK